MRRAFLVLLLANLLYAAWVVLVPRPAAPGTPRQVAAPGYPERLQLASESVPTPVAPGAAQKPDAPAAPEGVLVDAPVAQQSEGPAAPAPVVGAQLAPGEPAATLPAAAAAVAAAASDVAPAQATAGAGRSCLKIGPLEAAGAERLRRGIGEWVDGARVVQMDAPDRSVYWVHVPPLGSDADARAVVQALSGKGIDSFVIRDEPALLHGVSLGVFRDEASARSLQDRMSGIGHPVAIHEEKRFRSAGFVVGSVAGEAPGGIPQGLQDAVAAVAPEAVASASPCADIARDGAPD